MPAIIINHPKNSEFKIGIDIKRNGYDGQFKIWQNYEEESCGPDMPLENSKIIIVELNVNVLKFLKESVEELIESIKSAKKEDIEMELEADEFAPRVFGDSGYDYEDELFDDDLKTYYSDNPDARG